MTNKAKYDTQKQVSDQLKPLQLAFGKLDDLAITHDQVIRVAIEKHGDIYFELEINGVPKFWIFTKGELHQLSPTSDLKVPLVSLLKDTGFADRHSILSYRPERRIVLGPANGQKGSIYKGYKKNRAAPARLKYEIAKLACHHGDFDFPELKDAKIGDECIKMAMRQGRVPEVNAAEKRLWRDIGSRLNRFQSYKSNHVLPVFDCADELAVLDERARRFSLYASTLPQQWLQGRAKLDEVVSHLPPMSKVLTHRDLHDRQFIVSGKTVTLLDFDLLCIADVALDAGNLVAHLTLRALQSGTQNAPMAASECSEFFLDGLGRENETGFGQKLLFYQATTFYRLALLYALRPRWTHLSNALMELGRQNVRALR